MAPVRETCAQTLGVALAQLKADRVRLVAGLLSALTSQPQWEARHGALLGFKYLLAARQVLTLCSIRDQQVRFTFSDSFRKKKMIIIFVANTFIKLYQGLVPSSFLCRDGAFWYICFIYVLLILNVFLSLWRRLRMFFLAPSHFDALYGFRRMVTLFK